MNAATVNCHNMHYYATENPHRVRTLDHQQLSSPKVWGGIIRNNVIGPYFFDNALNGEIFAVSSRPSSRKVRRSGSEHKKDYVVAIRWSQS